MQIKSVDRHVSLMVVGSFLECSGLVGREVITTLNLAVTLLQPLPLVVAWTQRCRSIGPLNYYVPHYGEHQASSDLERSAHRDGSQGATVLARHAQLVQAMACGKHGGGSDQRPRAAVPAFVGALAVLDLADCPVRDRVSVRRSGHTAWVSTNAHSSRQHEGYGANLVNGPTRVPVLMRVWCSCAQNSIIFIADELAS